MAYVYGNPKTKKALREAVAKGEKLEVFQPGPFPLSVRPNGQVSVEGPHYPAAHSWYANVEVDENHIITRVVS